MYSSLIICFSILIAVSLTGQKYSGLPRNIWILFIAQPLALSSSSMVVFAGSLLGAQIAPSPQLATLPVSLMILMTAAGVIPASALMKKFGRSKGTLIGLFSALSGSLISALSALNADFNLLIVGVVLLGFSLAFVAQMRFAVMESVSDPLDRPKAVSVLMVGSMFAAVLGPEMATVGKDLINSPHGFAGSFLGLSVMLIISMLLVMSLDPIVISEQAKKSVTRKLGHIISNPLFLIAVASGAIASGVMSYVMTASPLSMHQINGHDIFETKWVVQSHIIAMYLPSLFSAYLIRLFGVKTLMLIGSILYFLVLIVALNGQHVMHYWWAMVLLGVGWNFLFTSGTVLLPESYLSNERFKAQATNDFSIFIVQALASLSSGVLLFSGGWNYLINLMLPVLALMLMIALWFNWLSNKEESGAVTTQCQTC